MRYVFLDTNIYVTCASLRKRGQDHHLVERLATALSANDAVLVVPEVVEAELDRLFSTSLESTRTAIKAYRDSVTNVAEGLHVHHPLEADDGLRVLVAQIDKSVAEVRALIQERLRQRVSDLNLAQRAIREVFKKRVVETAPLTPSAMTKAMLQTVRGERKAVAVAQSSDDSTDNQIRFRYGIEADQMVLESLIEYMNGKSSEDVVIICSDDTHCYVTKSGRTLRKEVRDRFNCEVRGYAELPALLSAEFDKPVSPKVAKEYGDFAKQMVAASALPLGQLANILAASREADMRGIRAFSAAMPSYFGLLDLKMQVLGAQSVLGESMKSLAASAALASGVTNLGAGSALSARLGLDNIANTVAAATPSTSALGLALQAGLLPDVVPTFAAAVSQLPDVASVAALRDQSRAEVRSPQSEQAGGLKGRQDGEGGVS